MASQDYSKPFTFDVPDQPPNKTVDIGCEGTSVSLDPFGRILQLSTLHKKHGIIVAVPFEQFHGNYKNPAEVHGYRRKMLERLRINEGGFGLELGQKNAQVSIQILDWNLARFKYTLKGGLDVDYETQVLKGGEVLQTATVTNTTKRFISHPFALNLCLSLNRASYGQLTEGGQIKPPDSKNIFRTASEEVFEVTNPHLEAQLIAKIQRGNTKDEYETLELEGVKDQEVEDGPLTVQPKGTIDFMPKGTVKVQVKLRMIPGIHTTSSDRFDDQVRSQWNDARGPAWKNEELITTYILRRAVDYNLATCTIPISDTAVAVIADHVALPLGWLRDNYFQVSVLLKTYKNSDRLLCEAWAPQYKDKIKTVVDGHLEWIFNVTKRPVKHWHRSYLVTGEPKDNGTLFQLDQQCYPLLELCDYHEHFPQNEALVQRMMNSSAITEVLELLEKNRDPNFGLIPTKETPADDKITYPLHFSSHVLLWRTYKKLSQLWGHFKPSDTEGKERLDSTANEIRDQVLNLFLRKNEKTGKVMFAYCTDGENFEFYHDGNDMPTIFAKEWGFVETDEHVEAWKNTMEFALSPMNEGYCGGIYAGIGSRHTRGPWTLGYFQELAYAVQNEDWDRAKRVWWKTKKAMQWDGTFSEAINDSTAQCSSKAWFAWPGSMFGVMIITMIINGNLKHLLEEDEF